MTKQNKNEKKDEMENSKPNVSDQKLISQINDLKNEVKDLTEMWRRTQADFENYRRRSEQQRYEMVQMAKADFMTKITPVLDNFRRAFSHIPENLKNDNFVIGIKQIEKQLEDILTSEGLTKIETVRKPFDPVKHEAISYEPSDVPIECVIDEVESGWQFNDKVIKCAKVRVSSGK